MKRFLLFCMDGYYPHGGWDDFYGDFDSLDEAKTNARREDRDQWHVVDTAHPDRICHNKFQDKDE